MDEFSAERLWGRRIPNHRLTTGTLPPPEASDDLLLRFGATFDGYAVRPVDLADWVPRVLERHERGEPMELSLTMTRAALFAFTRWHHMTTWSGELMGTWARCMRDLVERVRLLVSERDAGRRLPRGSLMAVEDGLMDAFERLLERYAQWGGYRFHGWTDFPDTANFQGPVVWSEADAAFRFALELEREFPRSVHMEFAIGKATRADYEPDVERRQRVDLAVSDLSGFKEDATSQVRFLTMQHDAFIETKWLVKGWRGYRFERDATKRVASVYDDIIKLDRHLALGRCQVAAVLVVDDEDYYAQSSSPTEKPTGPGVWRLIAGPRTLEQRGLLHRGWETRRGK